MNETECISHPPHACIPDSHPQWGIRLMKDNLESDQKMRFGSAGATVKCLLWFFADRD
jgi:hypothetical protein